MRTPARTRELVQTRAQTLSRAPATAPPAHRAAPHAAPPRATTGLAAPRPGLPRQSSSSTHAPPATAPGPRSTFGPGDWAASQSRPKRVRGAVPTLRRWPSQSLSAPHPRRCPTPCRSAPRHLPTGLQAPAAQRPDRLRAWPFLRRRAGIAGRARPDCGEDPAERHSRIVLSPPVVSGEPGRTRRTSRLSFEGKQA